MIYFTAHTFNCVCHCIRAMFRVLGMYSFAVRQNTRKKPNGLDFRLSKESSLGFS